MFDPFADLRKLQAIADEAIGPAPARIVQELPQFDAPDPVVQKMGPFAPAGGATPPGVGPGLLGPYTPQTSPAAHFQGDGHQHATGGNWVPLSGRWKGDPGLAKAFTQAQSWAGVPIQLSSAGRTHAEQVDLYRRKPGLAAKPGHSLHEKGLAIDVGNWRDPKVKAALERAGFRQFNSKKEPWHFSYGPKVG